MPVGQAALFPEEVAADLLRMVSGTEALRPDLPGVELSVATVRRMLGEHAAVTEVVAVWQEHAIAHAARARALLREASDTVDSHWAGPAQTAYQIHAREILDGMATARQALERAGGALQRVHDTVTGRYLQAVDSLTTAAASLARLAGGDAHRIPDQLVPAAQRVVASFIGEVSWHVEQVAEVMTGNLRELAEAQAAATAPAVPPPAAGLGHPDRWRLRPGGAGGA